MRILVLANNGHGIELFRRELLAELVKMGHDVTVSFPFDSSAGKIKEIGCHLINTPVDRRGINPIKDIRLIVRYLKLMNDTKPDIVITYTIKPNIYGGIVARFCKRQYVANITGLGTAFEKTGILRTVVTLLYNLSLKRAKVIFFENSENRDVLTAFCHGLKGKIEVLPGAGVNLEHFCYQPYPENDICKFLFMGRLMKEKGLDELLEAMKKLNAEEHRCSLDIVGTFEEDYKDKLEEYQKAGWLKYHGFQNDVRLFIKNCDCFVLPSYHEGMANTNLECAASGRPLITSNIPGCREAVTENSGLLCEPKNVESLYKAMKQIIEKSRLERARMGIAGRKHMEKVFDKKKVVEKTIYCILE